MRSIARTILVVLGMTSTSCTVGTRYFLYNSTDDGINLRYGTSSVSIPPREVRQIEWWAEHSSPLEISSGDRKWNYRISFGASGHLVIAGRTVPLPVDQFAHKTLSGNDFYVQLGNDGRICPVSSEHRLPGAVTEAEAPYCVSPEVQLK